MRRLWRLRKGWRAHYRPSDDGAAQAEGNLPVFQISTRESGGTGTEPDTMRVGERLRGWIGESMLQLPQRLDREEEAALGCALRNGRGFGWKRRWLYERLRRLHGYRVRRQGPKALPAGAGPSPLDVKPTGRRRAGKPPGSVYCGGGGKRNHGSRTQAHREHWGHTTDA